MKGITVCVKLSFSPIAKCYKILMIIFPANYRLGKADAIRKDVFSSNTDGYFSRQYSLRGGRRSEKRCVQYQHVDFNSKLPNHLVLESYNILGRS